MDTLILKSETSAGFIQATFLPEKGMNLISFKKNDIEIIDQTTKHLFDERFSGLGPLIGPHFHRRLPQTLPKIPNEELFPHIARVKAKGILDPFSHGIARYAPWKASLEGNKIKGTLTGKDLWNNVPLSALEGQNFTMQFEAELKEQTLFLKLSVVSDTDSLVGIHYFYRLPNGKGKVTSRVQKQYLNLKREKSPIPSDWNLSTDQQVILDLNQETDFTFRPFPNPLQGQIILETEEYTLKTTYECASEENSWQLYHPKDSSFVCIEPLSARDPKHPNLTVSSISIGLKIE